MSTPRSLPVYHGPFGRVQAERLLWRAGVGPRPGEGHQLAGLDMDDAVRSLTRPGQERLLGPSPRAEGGPLAPNELPSHSHAWWLDRMARTRRPLVERMSLVWHDWFATSIEGVDSPRLMLKQNHLLRRHALGSFANLLEGVTRDPAMLVWQDGFRNRKESPNENYAREMMELFTLGAGRGYTERDVREQARALTGWTSDRNAQGRPVNFRFDRNLHDTGMKVIFGKRGRFDWRDACRLCIGNPKHPSFFVGKLWSYFVPTPPSHATRRGLERLYRARDHGVRPVLEAILKHPDFYEGPPMVKPPVIYTAGLLRATGRGVDTSAWGFWGRLCGQELFHPPNVAGWNDERWLDSGTWLARWRVAAQVIGPVALTGPTTGGVTAEQLVERALRFWHRPALSEATHGTLLHFARSALRDAQRSRDTARAHPALIENALRQLIAVSPDFQVA